MAKRRNVTLSGLLQSARGREDWPDEMLKSASDDPEIADMMEASTALAAQPSSGFDWAALVALLLELLRLWRERRGGGFLAFEGRSVVPSSDRPDPDTLDGTDLPPGNASPEGEPVPSPENPLLEGTGESPQPPPPPGGEDVA